MICGAFGPYHTFCCLPFWFDFLLSCSFYMMYAFHNAFFIMLSVADLPMLLFSPYLLSFLSINITVVVSLCVQSNVNSKNYFCIPYSVCKQFLRLWSHQQYWHYK
jgi:hypothetical protein